MYKSGFRLPAINDAFFFSSPVKLVGGDCWSRGPALSAWPSRLPHSSVEQQPMEVTAGEPMDTSSSSGSTPSEASAPLPIRHPAGVSAGPYKKQTYPMNSKRPEHLRMNLWRSAPLRTSGLAHVLPSACFYCLVSETCRFFNYWQYRHCSPVLQQSLASHSCWLGDAA